MLKLLLIALSICASASTALASEIVFMTHFIKPFTWEENGKHKGFAIEMVQEMMKQMKHPEKFEIRPFNRGLQEVQTQSNRAFFIVARRPEREQTVQWVGPLLTNGVYFYKKRGAKVTLNNLEDLQNLGAISVGRGNADHTFLESKGLTNLRSVSSQSQSLQMLHKERVDVTPMGELVMPEMAKHAGINPKQFERTALKLYDSVVYLVFSKNIPKKVIAKWQQALDQLKSSEKYEEIIHRYLH